MTSGIWLCLHFPQLPLSALTEGRREQPIAIVERQRIHTCNPAAAGRGLSPGIGLANGYALCPDLLALERQPLRESEALAQLACWAYGLVQEVVLAADNSLLLEVGSCRRLYGGLQPLLNRIDAELQQRGHAVHNGIAQTPKAAWLLTRHAVATGWAITDCPPPPAEQLSELSLSLLPLDSKLTTGLQQTGINTLAELLALPLAALGKRFGNGFVRYLQQLIGELADPQPSFAPPPVFRQTLPFLDGIHDRQTLLFPMKRLIGTLCDYLRARQLLCREFKWRFYDAHRLQGELVLGLSQAQNRAATFLELSRLRMDQLELPEPVFQLELRSDAFLSAPGISLDLFEEATPTATTSDRSQRAELLDRLAARLGSDALQRLLPVEQHWPEAAGQRLALTQISPIPPATVAPAGPRPVWLLSAPERLTSRNGHPYWEKPLQLVRGPERITAPWWEMSPATRDYYEASLPDGSRCWIFRESDTWYLHGLFA